VVGVTKLRVGSFAFSRDSVIFCHVMYYVHHDLLTLAVNSNLFLFVSTLTNAS